MTNFYARALGACVLIFGFCLLTLVGFSLGGFFGLLFAVIVGLFKIAVSIVALGFVLVGFVWTILPHRALDTIERNKQHRKTIQDAERG